MEKNIYQCFHEAAERIKELGFRVFLSEDNTFGYYSDGKNIGYFQENEFVKGVNICTVNKTPGSSGMHYCLEPNFRPVGIGELTADYLAKGFQLYPDYFDDEFKKEMNVIKFSGLEEFLLHPSGKGFRELQN